MPPYEDYEGDKVTVKYDIGSALVFTKQQDLNLTFSPLVGH